MNILLTGSGGFIGRHFCLENRIKRIVLRNPHKGRDWKCEKYFINTLSGETDWAGAFDNIDIVIHLAGLAHSSSYSLDDYHKVNVEGTLHLARKAALAGVKRFVFVSSIGVHGVNTLDEPLTPSSPLMPNNDYTRSKLAAEVGLKQLSMDTGLELVIVRPTLVYGVNAPGNFGMLTKLIALAPLLPFGMINNRRDFIAVDNLKDLLLLCAEHPNAKGEVFLASDGESVSIGQFTNYIARGMKKNIIQLPIPAPLFRLVGRLIGKKKVVEQLVGNLCVDSSHVRQKLNWIPPTTTEEAMFQLWKKND